MAGAGCIEDRERPSPPRLTITLDKTAVRSINPPTPQDSVSGTMRVEDADGLDSVWITVDTRVAGEDAGFEQSFATRFREVVQAGKPPAQRIPVQLRARDIAGFEAQRDTYVVVLP